MVDWLMRQPDQTPLDSRQHHLDLLGQGPRIQAVGPGDERVPGLEGRLESFASLMDERNA